MATDHAGPRRLRQLLDAVLLIGSDLELPAMLRRVVETSVELVDARYGALGVLDESGTGLSEFITVGMDDETYRAIGALPKGLGLLGSLITKAKPLRVADLREHPDSAGFPPNHPPMSSFLGVPVRVRGQVFGNLYLTDKTTAEVFTDIDEELAMGLASAAGFAIQNARLFAQVRQREATLAAIQEVAAELVAGTDPRQSLELVAGHARELVGGDLATIALPEPDGHTLVLEVVDGPASGALAGQRFPRAGSVSGDVMRTGEMAVLDDASQDSRVQQPQVRAGDVGPAVFVALMGAGEPLGTLAVARRAGAPPFTRAEQELVGSFAAQAGVVLEHDRARQQLQRLAVLEDQERIARDLHDTVIQRLFASGLMLQGTSRLISDPSVLKRVESVVDELDITVRHIRTVIFGVEHSRSDRSDGARARLLRVTREAGRALGFEPTVTFDGPLDSVLSDEVADDIVATAREALSNVARHAGADHVEVELAVDATDCLLRVRDDGIGIEQTRSGGLGFASMRARAERWGGRLTLERAGSDGRGTLLEWCVPILRQEMAET